MACCPCHTSCGPCGHCTTLPCVLRVRYAGRCWTLNFGGGSADATCAYASCSFTNPCHDDDAHPLLTWALRSSGSGWTLGLIAGGTAYVTTSPISLDAFVCAQPNTFTVTSTDPCLPADWIDDIAVVEAGDCGADQYACAFNGCCCNYCRADGSGGHITVKDYLLHIDSVPGHPELTGNYRLVPTALNSLFPCGMVGPCCHYRFASVNGYVFEFGVAAICTAPLPLVGGFSVRLMWSLFIYHVASGKWWILPFGVPEIGDPGDYPIFRCDGGPSVAGGGFATWPTPCSSENVHCGGCCFDTDYILAHCIDGRIDPPGNYTITGEVADSHCSEVSTCADCGPLGALALDTTGVTLVNSTGCGNCAPPGLTSLTAAIRGHFTLNPGGSDPCGWESDLFAVPAPCSYPVGDDFVPLPYFRWVVLKQLTAPDFEWPASTGYVVRLDIQNADGSVGYSLYTAGANGDGVLRCLTNSWQCIPGGFLVGNPARRCNWSGTAIGTIYGTFA